VTTHLLLYLLMHSLMRKLNKFSKVLHIVNGSANTLANTIFLSTLAQSVIRESGKNSQPLALQSLYIVASVFANAFALLHTIITELTFEI